MKQPDRFERIVGEGFSGERARPQDLILARHAIRLLRHEHAWMRQMVERLDTVDYANMSMDYRAGMHHAYCTTLEQLAKRRK